LINRARYWIVDVAARTIEVFTDPKGLSYQKSKSYLLGDAVHPQCLPTAILPIRQLFSDRVQ
jgi:Uma2 family endonuclease